MTVSELPELNKFPLGVTEKSPAEEVVTEYGLPVPRCFQWEGVA
jgi:hypothetical protein